MDDNDGKTKYRISVKVGIFFLCLAAIADLVTLIPIAGTFLGWLFWGIMAVVFWKMGLGLVNWRRLVPALISAGAELFPAIQELPTIIAAMLVILVFTRIEDKLGVKLLPTKGKPGVTAPRLKRAPPAYKDGVRLPRQKDEDIPLAE